jgi:hypothetical protein
VTLHFRCQLVLMALDEYAHGDHVSDPAAFVRRCRTIEALRSRSILARWEA